jgi:acylphosphatase
MSGRTEAHVVVSGRVQGVWFRGTTQEVAERSGVSGYVRNLPDGRVEAVLQGEQGRVLEVLEFMRKGPPGAVVTDVAVDWRPQSEEYDGFRIRR